MDIWKWTNEPTTAVIIAQVNETEAPQICTAHAYTFKSRTVAPPQISHIHTLAGKSHLHAKNAEILYNQRFWLSNKIKYLH